MAKLWQRLDADFSSAKLQQLENDMRLKEAEIDQNQAEIERLTRMKAKEDREISKHESQQETKDQRNYSIAMHLKERQAAVKDKHDEVIQ